jgi:hypothetical protein
MTEATQSRLDEIKARLPLMAEAHANANREAVLEHARMGRSVSESRNGQVVWVTPEEIFARYGLDEHGKPKTDAAP